MTSTLILDNDGRPSVHGGGLPCSRCGLERGALYETDACRYICYPCLTGRPPDPRGPVRRTDRTADSSYSDS